MLLFCEHPAVLTLGRMSHAEHVLFPEDELSRKGISVLQIDRGGDVTLHAPGQLVVYPIINLRRRKVSVTEYILMLEEIMLRTSEDLGVQATRDARNRGVWIGDNKIGSVGIRVRHGVTFHGLALNVNLSLDPFQWIEPCGLAGVGVTSLEKELGKPVTMDAAKKIIQQHITDILC